MGGIATSCQCIVIDSLDNIHWRISDPPCRQKNRVRQCFAADSLGKRKDMWRSRVRGKWVIMSSRIGHVLVVDDDPMTLTLCQHALHQAGFSVEAINMADQVPMLLQQRQFDLILLDLQMPIVDGLTLLAQIRSHDFNIPIVIITGTATLEDAIQAIKLGAQGLLLKPFSAHDLSDTVITVVQKRRELRVYDRVAALRPLVRVSERLLTELDLPRLYDLIIETVRVELNADRASLMFGEDDEETLRIAACAGLPEHVQVGKQIKIKGSLAGWVALNRQPLMVDSRGEVTPPLSDLRGVLFEDQIVSALSVPLMAGHRVLGVLNAAKTYVGLPFTDADCELLVLLASQAVIAIENARLYADVVYSETRYRALLQHATDSVVLLDTSGQHIIDANAAVEQLSGYSRDELLQLEVRSLLPYLDDYWNPQDQSTTPTDLLAMHESPFRELSSEIETLLRTKEGYTTSVAISMSLVPHDGQYLLLLIARDISERQRMMQQLFQTEKLAAVGRLSASIAHEVNNPLQAIHNSLHLLINRPLTDEKRHRYLTMTQDEVERLISIVQRLIDFYRPSREGTRPTDLHELLESVLALVAKELESSSISLVCDLAHQLPLVFAIANHIKQVYINIILNAIEAMPGGGVLTIRTYVMEADDFQLDSGVAAIGAAGHRMAGASVVVEFSDTGEGVPAHELTKIFEPFYTTRSKGTGLGLAISYSIIEQHHGELTAISTPGQGTTFRMRLPVAQ